jgi:hypothetical protein
MSASLFGLLGHAAQTEEVKPGCRYRRQHAGNLTETVAVLGVRNNASGIPHVRFTVAFERPWAPRLDHGPRVLALGSFTETYRERIA